MTRVIIVDNEPTFRKGLKAILTNIGNVEVVGEASNGEEFLKLIVIGNAKNSFVVNFLY